MSIAFKNAFPILACEGLAVLLLPPKWPVVRIVTGVTLILYAVILLWQSVSGSASA